MYFILIFNFTLGLVCIHPVIFLSDLFFWENSLELEFVGVLHKIIFLHDFVHINAIFWDQNRTIKEALQNIVCKLRPLEYLSMTLIDSEDVSSSNIDIVQRK